MSDGLPPADAEALERALAPLRKVFRENLPERMVAIDAHAAAARDGDAEARRELHRDAHTLKGTAGSYGFDRVSETAGRVEALTEPEEAPGQTGEADLTAALEALRAAVTAAADGTG